MSSEEQISSTIDKIFDRYDKDKSDSLDYKEIKCLITDIY
jgi:hypothetical protein